MGYDLDGVTEAVLEAGALPELPVEVAPGATLPVAFDVHDDVGAVLFFRRWRNGTHDTELVVARRVDGAWESTGGSGGGAGGRFDELYRIPPPEEGWGGLPVLWCGEIGTTVGSDDQEDDDHWVVAIEGLAVPPVAAIRLHSRLVPVTSPCGAFVAIAIDEEAPQAWAVDRDGAPVTDADGRWLGSRSSPGGFEAVYGAMDAAFDALRRGDPGGAEAAFTFLTLFEELPPPPVEP
jgi:hypothetical protein